MNTQQLIDLLPLATLERVELNAAIATRGKYRGCIKANCPPHGTTGRIAWLALVNTLAPARVSYTNVMVLSDEDKRLFLRLAQGARRISGLLNRTEPAYRWNIDPGQPLADEEIKRVIDVWTSKHQDKLVTDDTI